MCAGAGAAYYVQWHLTIKASISAHGNLATSLSNAYQKFDASFVLSPSSVNSNKIADQNNLFVK